MDLGVRISDTVGARFRPPFLHVLGKLEYRFPSNRIGAWEVATGLILASPAPQNSHLHRLADPFRNRTLAEARTPVFVFPAGKSSATWLDLRSSPRVF